MNTVRCPVDTMDLTLQQLPPKNLDVMECEEVEDYMRWFNKTAHGEKYGWAIKEFDLVYNGCGSPFCMYDKNPVAMEKIVDKLVSLDARPERKRFMAYQAAIRSHYRGRLGRGVRKRVGYCFENLVKTTFPDVNNEYTGFRPIEQDPELHVETSSSCDDKSVID